MTQQSPDNKSHEHDAPGSLEREAEGTQGTIAEFVDFLRHNKKWWLTPIIIVLLLISVLIILGGSAAAPFIYTLF